MTKGQTSLDTKQTRAINGYPNQHAISIGQPQSEAYYVTVLSIHNSQISKIVQSAKLSIKVPITPSQITNVQVLSKSHYIVPV